MNTRIDTALAHWAYVAPLLKPAKNKAQHKALVEALDAVLGDLVAVYEEAHYPMPPAMSATETLRRFIARDGLRQSDVPEIGNRAKVSEILAGGRSINLRQSRALAARFGVSLELFLDR